MSNSTRDEKQDELKKVSKESKTTLIYSQRVDSTKLNLPVIKRWIEDEITAQLPDDDIAAGFIYELIAGEENPDIHAIEAQTDEFLGKKDSRKFCKQLWKHLLSAQEDKDGIPKELVEQRKKIIEEQRKANGQRNKDSRPRDANRGWYQRDRRANSTRNYRDSGSDYNSQRTNYSSGDDLKSRNNRGSQTEGRKTNYNRMSELSDKKNKYEDDHHDARERGPRDKTVF